MKPMLTSCLPRIYVHNWTSCHDDAEFEGRSVSLIWGRFTFEICFGLIARSFPETGTPTVDPAGVPQPPTPETVHDR